MSNALCALTPLGRREGVCTRTKSVRARTGPQLGFTTVLDLGLAALPFIVGLGFVLGRGLGLGIDIGLDMGVDIAIDKGVGKDIDMGVGIAFVCNAENGFIVFSLGRVLSLFADQRIPNLIFGPCVQPWPVSA